MSLRLVLFLLACGFSFICAGAERAERRVEVLSSVRISVSDSELRFASGSVLSVDLSKIEVIDLRHPARPARRSLKLAPVGSGVVLDLRHDADGALRFGRLFLTPDRVSAETFMAREFQRPGTTQEDAQ